jgi:hypothetical protein
MFSKRQVPVWIAMLAASLTAASLLVVVGCALDKNDNRPGSVFNRIGGHGGEVLEPKRCLLKVAILDRPFLDPPINEVVWRLADEQVLAPTERRALEANGLRVGRITGELPAELDSILKDEAPQRKVTPVSFFVESGEQAPLISSRESVEQVTLFVNRDERVSGKTYKDASGFFRVIARHDGAHGISVQIIPEIHHGPVRQTYQPIPNAAFTTQSFMINNGQQEESLRELAAKLVLETGQIAVIGCRPEQKRSIGGFLLAQVGSNAEQRHQKLILIWASRNMDGVIGEPSKQNDRPKLFKRLVGPAPLPTPSTPPAPTPPPPAAAKQDSH